MLTVLYYIFTIIHTTILCILSALCLLFTYPFQKSRYWVHCLSRYMTWLFFWIPGIRRKIEGLENIDKNKSYVIVLNHTSGVDILAAYKIPLNFRWVSKREVSFLSNVSADIYKFLKYYLSSVKLVKNSKTIQIFLHKICFWVVFRFGDSNFLLIKGASHQRVVIAPVRDMSLLLKENHSVLKGNPTEYEVASVKVV